MAPTSKQRQPSEAAAEQATLLGRYVAVPTDFFDVQTDGQRYLATVKQRHASRAGYVWLKFEADGTQVWVPDATARKWLISDEEAESDDADWYEVPELSDESDEDGEAEPEPAPTAAAASSGSGDVRGRVMAVLRVKLRAGTRPRSSAGTHGPAEVPGNAGGCHTGGGRRPLHLLRPSSLQLWRCAYPPNPPHTSPRHQGCIPGVFGNPTRTHDAAPPAQRTRATCLATLQRAPANFTHSRYAEQVGTTNRFRLRPRGCARHVLVAEAPAFRVPPRAPSAACRLGAPHARALSTRGA